MSVGCNVLLCFNGFITFYLILMRISLGLTKSKTELEQKTNCQVKVSLYNIFIVGIHFQNAVVQN